MKITATALALAVLAGPAFADQQVYPFKTHENFCPNGLQPVYAGGEICCGKPTTHMTYAQVMQHPVRQRHAPRRTHYIPAEKGIPTHKGLD